MPKTILNPIETQECCLALAGLSGARAKAEATRLADYFGCHVSRVYAATKDLRPKRKTRTDKGKRCVDHKTHPGMSLATSMLVANNLRPKDALELARANGFETPLSEGSYQRHLREDGLNRRQLRSNRVVYRSFEAQAPGDIFQFDITGLKTRWFDTKTRRLLYVTEAEVNRNHPNRDPRRQRVWAFSAIDDFSRFVFVRFKAIDKPTASDVINFELECFRAMGVPLVWYTDNDPAIVNQWNFNAAAILDRAFPDNGGFLLDQHKPKNPNATGKIERVHQVIEEAEKLIGALTEAPTLEELNLFAERVCSRKNWEVHSTTRIKPAIRFRAGTGVIRMAPDAVLDAAFNSTTKEVKVNGDLTIRIDSKRWQLPRGPQISFALGGTKQVPNPFPDLAIRGESINVIWPRQAEWFVAIARGEEYEFPKVEAVADAADEHKSIAEPTAVQNQKFFKAKAIELKRAAREAVKRGQKSPIVVPGFHVEFEGAEETRPAMMPRRQVSPSLAQWAEAGAVPPSMAVGRQLDYFDAVQLLQAEGELSKPITEWETGWLKSVFAGGSVIAETELRERLAQRSTIPQLSEVKSA